MIPLPTKSKGKDIHVEKPGSKKMAIIVSLMDDSQRRIFIDGDCTLQELTDKLAAQLTITTNPHEFSFFQLTEGLDSHRYQ